MVNAIDVSERYRSHFAEFEKKLNGAKGTPVHDIRRRALEKFVEHGYPTPREEDWKYTNLAPLAKVPFGLAAPFAVSGPARERFEREIAIEGLGTRLVFVNGRYTPELSRAGSSAPQAQVSSLAAVLDNEPDLVAAHLARYASYDDQALIALNTSFMHDGAFIRIPDRTVIEDPIHLVFLSATGDEPAVSHPRNLVVVGEGSQVTILETYCGWGEGVYFTNAVTEVVTCAGAVVDHYKVQQESERAFHVANVTACQHRDSSFTSHVISLGGALARNDVNVLLDGDGSGCTLNGLYMVGGEQHVDNHTVIDHAKSHCSSQETYKGVLNGKSKAVFNGEIVVRQDAQKTDAHQMNKNLVLSEDALIHTKPRLRINANDVKCTHGATVGMLDQDALFYLRSRGFAQEEARDALTYAFVAEILDLVKPKQLRAELGKLVMARLPAGNRMKEMA